MDFESPDIEKEFPGLYEPSSWGSGGDYSDGLEKTPKKTDVKKKDKAKEKGYAALGEDSSPEEVDTRSPIKAKKPKSFKFLHKKERNDKDERKDDKKKDEKSLKKERKKEKEEKKKVKEKEKQEKEERKKVKKASKVKLEEFEECFPVFGVPLPVAVERCPSHDGIKLPVVVRNCIDFVEAFGMNCEGIYRLSGVKSKVQNLRHRYNCGELVDLKNEEPHVVASLLKQFLRELPEPVLTTNMQPHFDDVALIPSPSERAETTRQLLHRLPTPNRTLVQYIFKHMGNVISRERETKMNYQNVCIVLSPTMQISHRVLNVFFTSHTLLFGNVQLKRYIPPITSLSERSIDDLKKSTEIEEEIHKQESFLCHLHSQIASGRVSRKKEERLWEAQRIVTLLNRQLKIAHKNEEKQRLESLSENEPDASSCESLKGAFLPPPPLLPPVEKEMPEVIEETGEDVTASDQDTEKEENVTVVEVSPPLKEHCSQQVAGAASSEDMTEKSEESHGMLCDDQKATVSSIIVTHSGSFDTLATPSVSHANESPLNESGDKRSQEQDVSLESNQSGENHVTIINITEHVPEATSDLCTISSNAVNSCNSVLQNQQQLAGDKCTPQSETFSHVQVENRVQKSSEDLEYDSLAEIETWLLAEQQELLLLNSSLAQKVKAEKAEICRLREEIQELQTLYGYRTYSYDSSDSGGSESDGDSGSEEELLQQLHTLNASNSRLQEENTRLVKRITKERETVVQLRVRLRNAHGQTLQSSSLLTTTTTF